MRSIVTDVRVEINIGNEEAKSGIDAAALPAFLEQLADISGIRVRGLMTLGPLHLSNDKKLQVFEKMQKLFIDNKAKKVDNIFMDILSMGMSGDFDIAILAGSNMVRVGTALFGARQYQ